MSATGKKVWRDLSVVGRAGVAISMIGAEVLIFAFACFGSLVVGQLSVIALRALLKTQSEKLSFQTGVCFAIPIAAAFLSWFAWREFLCWRRLLSSRYLPSVPAGSGASIPEWAIAEDISAIDLVKGDDFPSYALPRELRADL